MASGIGGQIALARVGSLYRSVNTLNLFANFTQESLEHTLSELEEGSLIGRRDAPPSHKGVDTGAGEIQLEPNPNALSHFVKGFMGTHVASLVTNATSTGANSGEAAGLAQVFHRFTPRQDAFSDRTFLEPYNIGVYRDVGSMWLYRGSIINTLKFDIEAGALVKATAGIMSRQVDLIERVAAISSLSRAGGRPWVWDMASVEVSTDTTTGNLAATTHFERLSLSYELPHEGVSFLDGTKLYGEFVPNDFRRIRIEGTLSFRDQSEYTAFKDYEARRLRVTMLNVNSAMALGNVASLDAAAFLGYYGMRFHIPQMKYLSWSAPIQGPNRITVSFTAKAEYNDAEGLMSVIEMNNIVSSTALTQAY